LSAVQLHVRGGESPAPDAPRIPTESVRVLLRDKSISYQRLLRESSHLLQTNSIGKRWIDVEQSLGRDGLRRILERNDQHTTHYEYLVAQDIHIGTAQAPHWLYFSFSVDKRMTNLIAEAKPGTVIDAAAGLCAELNLRYEDIMAAGYYPKSSILFDALGTPSAQAAASEYPILKKVKIRYDSIDDGLSASISQGFHIHLVFSDSVQNDSRGKQLFLTSVSGLDAPKDSSGRPVRQNVVEQDTYGNIRSRGSTEWNEK
jgi:hypothetical protein